jgi:alkylation response protein AidB-like acyl-CoA dehydrogenase
VVARCSRFVGGQAIQLHGGMGVSDECRISHLFKYIAVTNALFGSDTYHIERLGSLM